MFSGRDKTGCAAWSVPVGGCRARVPAAGLKDTVLDTQANTRPQGVTYRLGSCRTHEKTRPVGPCHVNAQKKVKGTTGLPSYSKKSGYEKALHPKP